MSFTRAQMRGTAYAGDTIPGLGFARTADMIETYGIRDAAAFRDGSQGEGDFSQAWQYRPGQSDPNQIRRGWIVESDVWTHQGDGYSDARTDLAYEACGWLHPTVVNECARLSLRHIYFLTRMPVTPWQDGDFASSSLTSPYDWTANASGTTPSKDSTAARNTSGKRSLVLTGAGYVDTSSFYVSPGDQIVHGCDASAETGATFTYELRDVTHGTVLYTNNHASRAFRHMIHVDLVPDGCFELKARFKTAGGVSVVDTTFGHLVGAEQRTLTAPGSLTEAWRLLGFGPAEYGRSVGTDMFNATSRRFNGWTRPHDFDLDPLLEEANSYTLQINRDEGLGSDDLWYYMMRPWSDIDALTDEDGVTEAPEDLLMAAFYYELSLRLKANYPTMQSWESLRIDQLATLQAQRKARQPSSIRYGPPEVYVPGGRRGGAYGAPNPLSW